MYQNKIKRIFDLLLALTLLIVFLPLLIFISILVFICVDKRILFVQVRPGLNEKPFKLYKFKTMTDTKNDMGEYLPDSERITKFGNLLRMTSLDELPELLNILKGDMSFVGPRPQLIKDLIFMTKEQRTRHNVKPGLTGLAQISGRNRLDWISKLKLDVRYVQNINAKLDLKILIKTTLYVFKIHETHEDQHVSSLDYGDYLLKNNIITKDTYDHIIETHSELLT